MAYRPGPSGARARRVAPLEVFGAAAAAEPTSEPAAEPTSEPTSEPTAENRRTRIAVRENTPSPQGTKTAPQNKTQETSWRKPLCLKEAELCPYPSFDDYVFRIQARQPRPRGLHSCRWRRDGRRAADEAARET